MIREYIHLQQMKKPGGTIFCTEARQQPHDRFKMSWAILKNYREKRNGYKESRALNFVWKLIIIADSIAIWGVRTLENRKGDSEVLTHSLYMVKRHEMP